MEDREHSGPVYVAPIKQENLVSIITADSSEWYWILLPDGSRMVGFFPYEEGSEYWHDENHPSLEWQHINNIDLYSCDACDRMVPEDEIHHSLGINNGQGDTSQCDDCLEEATRNAMRGIY